jgi:REP element-mobilizing transposase RayT
MASNVKMRTLFHCVYALTYHLVLVTKYRRPCITRPMLEMLQDIAAQRCKDWGGELMEFNGEADHVHALVSLPPNLDLSRFVISRPPARAWCAASTPASSAGSIASRYSGRGRTASSRAVAPRCQ